MRGSASEAMGKEGDGWGWGGRRSEACGKTTTGAAPLGEGKHGTGMDLGWVGGSDALGSSLVCARAHWGRTRGPWRFGWVGRMGHKLKQASTGTF
jgi:hypothetical protein